MKKLACVLACAVALTACSTTENLPAEKSLQALDGEWTVVNVKGQDFKNVKQVNPAFIGIKAEDNRLYGSSSCNRIMSDITYDKKEGLKLGNVASTMMMCPDADLERVFLEALAATCDYKFEGDTLLLVDDKDATLVELARAK